MIWKEGTSGKPGEKNYSNIFFPFFFYNMRKSKQISHVRRSRKGQSEPGKNIQGKTSIDWKMATRITIDRKLPIKATANPQKLWVLVSYRRSILTFGTHPRKVSLLQFFVSSVLVSYRRTILTFGTHPRKVSLLRCLPSWLS